MITVIIIAVSITVSLERQQREIWYVEIFLFLPNCQYLHKEIIMGWKPLLLSTFV